MPLYTLLLVTVAIYRWHLLRSGDMWDTDHLPRD